MIHVDPAFHTGSEMEQSRSLVVPVSYSKVKKNLLCLGSSSSFTPHAVKVHQRLPHHFTGKSQHELITSQHDNKRIKFTHVSVATGQEAVPQQNK